MKRAMGFSGRLLVPFLGFILTSAAFPVLAQDAAPPAGDQAGAPPARAVRLSSVEGQVQLSQGNQVLAQQALANTPLFEGSRLTTSDDGRAEVQFEDGSVARVSPNSSMTLTVLRQQGSSEETELELISGLGYFEIQGSTQSNQMRIRFGDNAVTASGFTVLRVNLDNPPGEVAVFSGNAHLEGPSSLALDMHGGESVKLNSSDPGNYTLAESIEPDSWDAWNSDRDQALTAEEANRTAATNAAPNSNNPAWNDLDSNGNWYNVPGQGYVWSPYEAQNAGWEPYGCGNWVWEPGYGYVWVSCESWGFMPYAYGTWNFYDGFGWGWCPGLAGPWWGLGFWNFNIGATPVHYQPPHRPHGGPVHPVGGNPIRPGGPYQPFPVVTVNRIRTVNTPMPMHPRTGTALLAGNTVEPLRPVAPRPIYDHTTPTGIVRGPVTYGGTGAAASAPGPRYGFVQGSNPNGVRPPSGVPTMPAAPAPGRYVPYSGGYSAHPAPPAPPSHGGYSGGYVAPRSSAPAAPAPAPRAGGGGSFGGGAPHAGGSVGAGGGGSHGGGGGGGGGHH